MLLNVQNNFQNMGIINNHGNVVSISWESNLGHVIFSGMWLHDGNFSEKAVTFSDGLTFATSTRQIVLGIIPRNGGDLLMVYPLVI